MEKPRPDFFCELNTDGDVVVEYRYKIPTDRGTLEKSLKFTVPQLEFVKGIQPVGMGLTSSFKDPYAQHDVDILKDENIDFSTFDEEPSRYDKIRGFLKPEALFHFLCAKCDREVTAKAGEMDQYARRSGQCRECLTWYLPHPWVGRRPDIPKPSGPLNTED